MYEKCLAPYVNHELSFHLIISVKLLYSFCRLGETVKREALNGVFDIDTIKVVTPAVLVGQNCVCLCVCARARVWSTTMAATTL